MLVLLQNNVQHTFTVTYSIGGLEAKIVKKSVLVSHDKFMFLVMSSVWIIKHLEE